MKRMLRDRLEALYRQTDTATRLRNDPIAFPHRYTRPADIEIAAVFSSQLAYGRVSLFAPVLDALFAQLDAWGGPEAAVRAFTPRRAAALPFVYRFNRPPDLALLLATLQRVLDNRASLRSLFPLACQPLPTICCVSSKHRLSARPQSPLRLPQTLGSSSNPYVPPATLCR